MRPEWGKVTSGLMPPSLPIINIVELRAVDYLTLELVEQMATSKRYFDFGISNTDQGRVLDSSLCRQKEEFGGRGVVHEFFRMEI